MTPRRRALPVLLLAALPPMLLAGCAPDEGGTAASPDRAGALAADLAASGSFEPAGERRARPPAEVAEMRQIFRAMEEEGVALALRERPAPDRIAWLVHLSASGRRGLPANWIVSSDGELPAPVAALRIVLARFRARAGDGAPVVVGFTPDGDVIDETTGRVMASGPATGPGAAGSPGRISLTEVGEVGRRSVELPGVGRVRFQEELPGERSRRKREGAGRPHRPFSTKMRRGSRMGRGGGAVREKP